MSNKRKRTAESPCSQEVEIYDAGLWKREINWSLSVYTYLPLPLLHLIYEYVAKIPFKIMTDSHGNLPDWTMIVYTIHPNSTVLCAQQPMNHEGMETEMYTERALWQDTGQVRGDSLPDLTNISQQHISWIFFSRNNTQQLPLVEQVVKAIELWYQHHDYVELTDQDRLFVMVELCDEMTGQVGGSSGQVTQFRIPGQANAWGAARIRWTHTNLKGVALFLHKKPKTS